MAKISKKVIIISAVILFILGAVGYWLYGPDLPFGNGEEADDLGDDVSVLLATLEQETDIGFSEAGELEFNWNVFAEGKVNAGIISGKGFEVHEISAEQEARINSFFYDKGFEIDVYNIAAGTMSGAAGYKKDNLVCVISSYIQLDEQGLPLEGYKRDVQVKCGENGGSIEASVLEDKEKIQAKIGESFSIVLETNPTTGYEWQFELDVEYLELVSQDYAADSEELIGSGGRETFVFQPLKSGETELKFSYLRSWEGEAIEQRIYEVVIE